MQSIPFFDEIEDSNTILLAGAGGGFDIYSGVPLFFHLKNQGKTVYLASYTLTDLDDIRIDAKLFDNNCSIITHTTPTPGPDYYFPEKFMTDWFYESHHLEVPIYTFHRVGPGKLRKTYQKLVDELDIDTIVLIDGGNDSLMKGDEVGLGTPVEDMTSMVSAHSVGIKSYLVCLGVTVDYFHGVQDEDNWKALAELIELDGDKGIISLHKDNPEVQHYIDLVDYANKRKPSYMSIVQNSIVSALLGKYGNYHRTPRTKGSILRISPVMAQYWCFSLDIMIQRLLYIDRIQHLDTLKEVIAEIMDFTKEIRDISAKDLIDTEEELKKELKTYREEQD